MYNVNSLWYVYVSKKIMGWRNDMLGPGKKGWLTPAMYAHLGPGWDRRVADTPSFNSPRFNMANRRRANAQVPAGSEKRSKGMALV